VRPPLGFAPLRKQALQMGSQGDYLGPCDQGQFFVAATQPVRQRIHVRVPRTSE